MPIYEYKCKECQKTFEFIQKFSDEPKKTCPECKKDTLEKMLSSCAFSIKGGGVYSQGMSVSKNKHT